jgi:hypothetical protein
MKRATILSKSVNNIAGLITCPLHRQLILFPRTCSFLSQRSECKVYGPCSQMCNFMPSILQEKGMTSSRLSYGLTDTKKQANIVQVL